MDCNNVNIKELIQQAEKAEKYKKSAEYYEERYNETRAALVIVEDFFRWLINGEFSIRQAKNVDDFREIISSRLENSDQNWLLAKERAEYNKEFKEQMQQFEDEMNWQREELVKAWEKFRIIKAKKYQQTLKEINEENL